MPQYLRYLVPLVHLLNRQFRVRCPLSSWELSLVCGPLSLPLSASRSLIYQIALHHTILRFVLALPQLTCKMQLLLPSYKLLSRQPHLASTSIRRPRSTMYRCVLEYQTVYRITSDALRLRPKSSHVMPTRHILVACKSSIYIIHSSISSTCARSYNPTGYMAGVNNGEETRAPGNVQQFNFFCFFRHGCIGSASTSYL